MFDIGYSELLVIAVVALIVIGPKDLPRVMRTVGNWVGRARGMARHFRSGIDTMIRESELEEMEKKWREENERIMREHPFAAGAEPPPLTAPPGAGAPGETTPPAMIPDFSEPAPRPAVSTDESGTGTPPVPRELP